MEKTTETRPKLKQTKRKEKKVYFKFSIFLCEHARLVAFPEKAKRDDFKPRGACGLKLDLNASHSPKTWLTSTRRTRGSVRNCEPRPGTIEKKEMK